MAHETKNVGVIGGSGYIGSEILRYLATHPHLNLAWVTANTHVGKPVREVLPNLSGSYDHVFCAIDEAEARLGEIEALFVALPHNASQEVIPRLAAARADLVIIDMGGDFRSNDLEGYQKYYGREHTAPELLSRFVYGQAERRRDELRRARERGGPVLVANPGCFATTLNVALAPLAAAGKLDGDVFAAAITGSSGAGNKPLQTTHHPERATNIRGYKVLGHQHNLEIESFLRTLTDKSFRLHFVPQAGPYVRGIFATVFTPGIGVGELEAIYREHYDAEPLIDVVRGSPELRWVQGTPRAVVGFAGDAERSAVLCVSDNLGKGAAGQAIQNLNNIFGFDETSGLDHPGGFV